MLRAPSARVVSALAFDAHHGKIQHSGIDRACPGGEALRQSIRERRATIADFLGAPAKCRHSNRAVAMLVGKPAGRVNQRDLAQAIKLLQSGSMLVGVSDRLVEASVMFAAAAGLQPREMISCSNPVC